MLQPSTRFHYHHSLVREIRHQSPLATAVSLPKAVQIPLTWTSHSSPEGRDSRSQASTCCSSFEKHSHSLSPRDSSLSLSFSVNGIHLRRWSKRLEEKGISLHSASHSSLFLSPASDSPERQDVRREARGEDRSFVCLSTAAAASLASRLESSFSPLLSFQAPLEKEIASFLPYMCSCFPCFLSLFP